MAAFFKLPPQEFTVKVGVILAAGMQVVAVVFLFIMALRYDGQAIQTVLDTLTKIALGSGIMGTLIGMVHLGGTTMARVAQSRSEASIASSAASSTATTTA